MNLKTINLFPFKLVVLLVLGFFALTAGPNVHADLSSAGCTLDVYVDNSTGDATISGTVRERHPGQDNSYTYVSLYDSDNAGNADVSGGYSVWASYTAHFSDGVHTAYIQGVSFSNPNGGTSDCYDEKSFTVYTQPPAPNLGNV